MPGEMTGSRPNVWTQLSRLEYIHSRNLVFRDVKPENFVVGRRRLRKDQTIYVVDLGLAKEYVVNGTHIPLTVERNITGTVRYVSVNTHQGAGPTLAVLISLSACILHAEI